MRIIKTLATVLISIVIICISVSPIATLAAEKKETVRVGWYESPFNITDEYGRRSGYAYDYQKKIAAYTGWKYEYVEGSWPELMQMLIDGEIDIMSDVSYTEERSEIMLFSSLPMGAEEYYIFISPENNDINKDDLSTFNGKKVGINKGSVQVGFFSEWAKTNGVDAEIIEMTEDVDKSIEMLNNGDIDMYVVLDGYFDASLAVPVCKVGASDFYFAVNKSRPDLQASLNSAMNRIQEEDHNYNQRLYEKYLKAFGFNYYLSTEEKNWLSKHGKIRIGYLDNYLSFCAADKKTGKLTGALKDYLEDASTCLKNAELSFESVAYPSSAAAIKALRNGEIDCLFPSNLSTSDGEELGLIMTPKMMTSDINAVVQKKDQNGFFHKEQITAAVLKDNPNYNTIMKDYFPEWQQKEYTDIQACLEAVSDGKADCVIISNYQYNYIARLCNKLNLTELSTGKNLEYYIALNENDTELYSILTRITDIVSETSINAALSYYSSEEAKLSVIDIIKDNPAIAIAIVAVIIALLVIILMQQRVIGARREIEKSHSQVADLNRRVYIDALTSVKNKGGFNEYIKSIQRRIDNKEPLEFAIIILDCDNLKGINDEFGHDKGDEYIRATSALICKTYKHSPVFRIGGDEFAVILQNDDYQNREELIEQFEEKKKDIQASAENGWEKVSVSIGMAAYKPEKDYSVEDVVRRADRKMYDNKRQ